MAIPISWRTPMKQKTIHTAVLMALLPAFVAGCSPSTAATMAPSTTPAQVDSRAAAPDFTRLAEQAGPAVVNISVTEKAAPTTQAQPPVDKSDPMYQFFRRFGVP